MSGDVSTPYGPMPGCPDCGIIVTPGGTHICEHGVTAVEPITVTITGWVDDATYAALTAAVMQPSTSARGHGTLRG